MSLSYPSNPPEVKLHHFTTQEFLQDCIGIPTGSCTGIPTGYIETVYKIGIEKLRRNIMGVGHCKQSKEVGSVTTSPFASK